MCMGVTWLASLISCGGLWSQSRRISLIRWRTLHYQETRPEQCGVYSSHGMSESEKPVFTLFPSLLFADPHLELRARKGFAEAAQ